MFPQVFPSEHPTKHPCHQGSTQEEQVKMKHLGQVQEAARGLSEVVTSVIRSRCKDLRDGRLFNCVHAESGEAWMGVLVAHVQKVQ